MQPAPFFPEIAKGPNFGAAFWVTAQDGKTLRVGIWRADTLQKGTIFIFPGRTEYIELQGRIALDFVAQGYAVATVDWRGHGLSERLARDPMTLHVDSYADYQHDVAALVELCRELDVPKPWFLIGNSMGGNIGLRAIMEGFPATACAFAAPMWEIKMSRVQKLIAAPVSWAANLLGRGQSYVPGHDCHNYVSTNPFEGNRLTFDPDGYAYWVNQAREKPELQTAGSSMKWLLQSLLECSHLAKRDAPSVPCLAFCGDHDEVVEVAAIKDRMACWENGRFITLDDAKHALLFERNGVRERIISEITALFSRSS